MFSIKLVISLACLFALAIHGRMEAAANQIPFEGISSNQDVSVAAIAAEKVEFLGYIYGNESETFEDDCRQWPAQEEPVTVGEVWWQDGGWYAQTVKFWNHRHALDWGLCVETRFVGDKNSGQIFYPHATGDTSDYSSWALQAYTSWNLQLAMGYVGWNADKARWLPCTNVPGCGVASRFAMNKSQCFRVRIKSGRIIRACKTYTNDDNRICGEYSRKHHGRYRCGTGRDSHYWFGTDQDCRYN